MSCAGSRLRDFFQVGAPVIGVTIGLYLVVLHSNGFWVEMIGSTDVILASVLLVLSIAVFVIGILPIVSPECYNRLPLNGAYPITTLVIFLLIAIISTRISISGQHEREFWIDCFESNSSDFRITYESDDDVRQFIRARTEVPHTVVVALTYVWIVVFLLSTSWRRRFSAESPERAEELVRESSEEVDGVEAVPDLPAPQSDHVNISPVHEEEEEEVKKPAEVELSRQSEPSVIIEVREYPPRRTELPPTLRQIEIDPPPRMAPPGAPVRRYQLDDGAHSLSESSDSYSGYYDSDDF
jgi:hypothetical protein